jgi:hypothetical protein
MNNGERSLPLALRIERIFFAAMLLTIVLEAACVYWFTLPVTFRFDFPETGALAIECNACMLPQYWLLGAPAVLLYRIAVVLAPPKGRGQNESENNRSAFLHLGRWPMAVGSLQMVTMYLECPSVGAR